MLEHIEHINTEKNMSTGRIPRVTERFFDIAIPLDTLENLAEDVARYGDVFFYTNTNSPHPILVMNTAEAASHILGRKHHNYRKGLGIERVRLLLGNGLMASEDPIWKKQRQLMQPHFQKITLEKFVPLMQDCVQKLQKQWLQAAHERTSIHLTEMMSETTLSCILQAILSEDLKKLAQTLGADPFALLTDESARDLAFARQFRALAAYIKTIIQERLREQRFPTDFLSMMLTRKHKQTHEVMPLANVVNEVMTLIVAGHETTAAALSWTWYLLANHSDVMKKLQTEVSKLAGRIATYTDFPTLPYTQAVLQESMRLYPPGWLLTRQAMIDDVVDEISIVANTQILISPYLLQRHEKYWCAPEKFQPERFLVSSENLTPYAYLAFAAGGRKCIGDQFAMYEMTIHLATLAQQFILQCENSAPVKMAAQVNLRPQDRIQMCVTLFDSKEINR